MNGRSRKIFYGSLVASLVVHGLIMLFTFVMPTLHKAPPDVVEFQMLDENELEKLQAKLGQFVDQSDKALNNEVPKETKFSGKNNQVVKKETRAQNFGQFQNGNAGPQTGEQTGTRGEGMNRFLPKMDYAKAVEKQKMEELNLEKSLEEDALRLAKKRQEQAAQQPSGGGNGNLSSQTSDYLKDVETGSETLLSTREFIYHSFYSRIRQQLNQHWSGKVRSKLTKMFKAGRTIASTDDKITKLLITLNNSGQLVKVQVLSDSGVRDLDEAAIEAFNEAAPFPNPPKGIVESDGTIKIRWDFVLEV